MRYDMIIERRGGILRAFPYHEFSKLSGLQRLGWKKEMDS
jgi:hypothetical protein